MLLRISLLSLRSSIIHDGSHQPTS
jgi:hypothetical protein